MLQREALKVANRETAPNQVWYDSLRDSDDGYFAKTESVNEYPIQNHSQMSHNKSVYLKDKTKTSINNSRPFSSFSRVSFQSVSKGKMFCRAAIQPKFVGQHYKGIEQFNSSQRNGKQLQRPLSQSYQQKFTKTQRFSLIRDKIENQNMEIFGKPSLPIRPKPQTSLDFYNNSGSESFNLANSATITSNIGVSMPVSGRINSMLEFYEEKDYISSTNTNKQLS